MRPYLVGFVFLLIAGCSSSHPAPASTPTTRYALSLVSSDCGGWVDIGFVTCQGAVQNISDQPLKNVEAVVEWQDDTGTVIASDTAVVTLNPIEPGEVSPWRVVAPMNRNCPPKYRVVFKSLPGASLETRDDRGP